jgi:3-deoxy-D-manno-octulosonate 8-phosphate phosphatase (KDO 8-P phosphatase)
VSTLNNDIAAQPLDSVQATTSLKTVHATGIAELTPELVRKCAAVKLFLCDVDGVLTDGTVIIGQDSETKRFNIQDGLGMRLLQRSGILIGWVSNRPSFATTQRAKELQIDYVYQRDGVKVEAAEVILRQAGVQWNEVCYMGDDIVDLGVLRRAGLAVAVANALAEAKAVSDYVTKYSGGFGAVREVVELILKAQGKWAGLVEHYCK